MIVCPADRRRPPCPTSRMLSQKAKYALRALTLLADRADEDLIQIGDIAERENIPRKFLEAILVELRRQGLLYAKRGKAGGYRLARPPSEISLGVVIRLMDGMLAPIPCASRSAYQPCDDCEDPATCYVRRTMIDVRNSIAAVLESRTLADALAHRRAVGTMPLDYDI